MNLDSTISLQVGGTDFQGWKSVEAVFDMEALTPTVSIAAYDKDASLIPGLGMDASGSPFPPGESCSVSIQNPAVMGTTRVLDGFIVARRRTIDGGSSSLELTAADKTIDLLDCSAIHASRTWFKKPFSKIARDLASPFGIVVDSSRLQGDGLIEKFTLQAGESPFDAIERLCRSQGVLPGSNFDGALVLGYAATVGERAVEALEVGKNVLRAEEIIDASERYSEYTVIGQGAGAGKKWTRQMLQAAATARDTGVARHRPKLLIAENKITNDVAIQRVKWEAQVRSGRSTEYQVSVRGWYQKPAGIPVRPWQKNERVSFTCSEWGVSREFLVTRVEMSLDAQGERTKLTLKHPDIFNPQPGLVVDLT